MRQRAAIAMALACEPRVLLADEPTTALDVMVQAQILDLLTSLSNEFGLTLVFVTHDLPVIAELCDRAAVMYAGEIVEEASVDDPLPRPAAPVHTPAVRRDPRPAGRKEVVSIPGAPPGSTARSWGVPSGRAATCRSIGASRDGRCSLWGLRGLHWTRAGGRRVTGTTTRGAEAP